ncbi:MAG: hypothetical protein ACX938_15935, partial [Roseivivax sp.]
MSTDFSVALSAFQSWVATTSEYLDVSLHCCDPRFSLHLMIESGPIRGPEDEEIEVQRRADHRDPAGAGSGREDR